MSRLPVKKTYKLFIGGGFPRSESGRTYEAEGQNVARASRKDARDAVVAARKAQPGWASATAYNRGQVLYRLAEMMETRTTDLAAVCSGKKEVEAAIDRIVWYAGWADKLAQVIGSSNPVSGPYFNFSVPEPTGVVAVLAPEEPALERPRRTARTGDREWQRSRRRRLRDAPARRDRARRGDRHVRSPRRRRQHPHRPERESWRRYWPGHMDVNAIDVTGADGQAPSSSASPRTTSSGSCTEPRTSRAPGTIASFLELKTVWHPIGQ